jgi:hypothetical protein
MRDTSGETRSVIVDTRGWKEAESGPLLALTYEHVHL